MSTISLSYRLKTMAYKEASRNNDNPNYRGMAKAQDQELWQLALQAEAMEARLWLYNFRFGPADE